jgi:hypothetical protein
MSLTKSACGRLLSLSLTGLAAVGAMAQSSFSPQGGEYSLSLRKAGDEVKPALALGATGGYVIWEDNATDGSGQGVTLRALNNFLSPVEFRTVRVNQTAAGDQENAVVRLAANGAAVVVWQGGPQGEQDIFVRFLKADGTFATDEIRVNTFTRGQQQHPDVAILKDGSVFVVWASEDADGSMQGVYGQRYSMTGQKFGTETRINTATAYNQRDPAVIGLDDGDYLVAWISEQQRFQHSVDVFARRYAPNGSARGGEYSVNTASNLCANPALAAIPGGYVAAWSERDPRHPTNDWNVAARVMNRDGSPVGGQIQLNSARRGKRYAPEVAYGQGQILVVWTSDWQDGAREGVYGRLLKADGLPVGEEFRVNTTTIGPQMHPAVASDGESFLVAWSSFAGLDAGMEILAQRFSAGRVLSQPAPPFVVALDSYSLMASWPELAGYGPQVSYLVFVDGGTARRTADNFLLIEDLEPGSNHTVELAVELPDGRITPKSEATAARTWGRDRNYDGLPDDWQAAHWGADSRLWPSPLEDSDGDGASNRDEFLAGTAPANPESVLRITLQQTDQGSIVAWNSEPGGVYRLEGSTDLQAWAPVGSYRFAASRASSVLVTGASATAYYRIVRIR